jgi:hypothetical protein
MGEAENINNIEESNRLLIGVEDRDRLDFALNEGRKDVGQAVGGLD